MKGTVFILVPFLFVESLFRGTVLFLFFIILTAVVLQK